MALQLSRKHFAQLLEWANEAGNRECCGLLLGQGEIVFDIAPAANVSANSHTQFELDPVALIAAHQSARTGGPQIIGYYHSHPNGLAEPSPTDISQAANDDRYWLIIANDNISAWKPHGGGSHVIAFDPVRLVVEG